jgi:recombination protein RecA
MWGRISARTYVRYFAASGIFALWTVSGTRTQLVKGDRAATLQQIVATIQRRWGARALRILGASATEQTIPVVTTGFAAINRALGIGGLPRGRLTELLGTPTSGMTTLALTVLACAQANGDLTGYVDLSRTFDAEYAALLGVDLAALLLVRPPSAADALEIIHALVASGGVGVLLVDSLVVFQSHSRDAPLLAQALRVLPSALASSPCALIALTPLPYSPSMTRALGFQGSLLAHAAAIRMHIARESWLPTAQELPGCNARISILKHQLAATGGTAQVLIRFADMVQL